MGIDLSRSTTAGVLVLALAVGGCGEALSPGSLNNLNNSIDCSIPEGRIFSGASRDGIPALTNPEMVQPGDPGASYLRPTDRVIGIRDQGEVIAIPLNIMWWHEIVNIDLGGVALAVTHCPLTGSSLAFDRSRLGNVEFGVSGLLFQNNLMMYDRSDAESLWPQMSRGARCGPQDGVSLNMFPVVETTWEWWVANNPDTRVVSSATGYIRADYIFYPYGDYDLIDNSSLLFPTAIDPRRPPKERVLGVPDPAGGVAYPFGEMALLGDVAVIAALDGAGVAGLSETVIFWDASGQAAMAYAPVAGTMNLSFTAVGGQIVDNETGSVWRVDGVAASGPFAGSRLEGVADAYVAYWFAWAVFEPNTTIWSAP